VVVASTLCLAVASTLCLAVASTLCLALCLAAAGPQSPDIDPRPQHPLQAVLEPAKWAVGDLKRFLQARGVTLNGLLEKGQLVDAVLKILSGEIELDDGEEGGEPGQGDPGGEPGQRTGRTAQYAAEHPRDRMYFNGGGQGFLTDTEQLGFQLPNSAAAAKKLSETFATHGGARDVQKAKLNMALLGAPQRDEVGFVCAQAASGVHDAATGRCARVSNTNRTDPPTFWCSLIRRRRSRRSKRKSTTCG